MTLNRANLAEAVAIVVSSIYLHRREKFLFRDSTPGLKWIRAFYTRQKKELKYAVPEIQEPKPFAAVKAENIATHCSVLVKLVEEYELDDKRIWNLDETGVSAWRDTSGKVRQPRFMPRDEPATDIKKDGVRKTD